MPTKPAACPHCAVVMRAVGARSRNGYSLLLDQCPQCGGIWCDRWELYPLDAGEALRIDTVDQAQLQAAVPQRDAPGRCPRCTAPLHPFRDPALPSDARIERCAVCDGMWLNRGVLSRIKRRTPPRPAGADAALVTRVGKQLGASTEWASVGNLDAATYAADESADGDDTSWRSALRQGGPWLALAALLRLLLR
ncbi:MAG: zf-TFIIB domain-containing protein [bacterium]